MGVEFRSYLILRDNTVRPDMTKVRELIATWREAGFLPHSPGVLRLPGKQGRFEDQEFDEQRELSAPEFILHWSVADRRQARLTHPLADIEEIPTDGAYYDINLHFAEDFVETASEMIYPAPPICGCGEDLSYDAGDADLYYSARIRRICSGCGAAFRPQDYIAEYTNGVTGASSEIPGGATYRFAIVVDCGKHWRTTSEEQPAPNPKFVELSSAALGIELYDVGDFY